MKNAARSLVVFACSLSLLLVSASFEFAPKETSVKCLIQLANYSGEGAYVVVSLINPNGEYEQTLYVQGQEEKWYHDLPSWWNSIGKSAQLDGITGATTGSGGRDLAVLSIDDSKINKGYKLRFETSVEDKGYHETDVEFELNSDNLNGKFEGTGFIRYVRLMQQ